jgi:hypothetical protein
MSVDKGLWFENQGEIEDRLLASPKQTYTITDPAGGDVRTFNPNTASVNELMDFVATLAKDIMG